MRQLEDAGAAAVVMTSLFEEQIRAEDTAYALFTEHGSYSQAEAEPLFPRAGRLRRRRVRPSRDAPPRQRGARHPGHRQPQRHHRRRVDRARAESGAGRRARDRAERLLGADRRGGERRRGGAPDARHRPAGPVERRHPDQRQARAVLHRAAAFRGRPGAGRRGRPGALQPLLRAGYRSRQR